MAETPDHMSDSYEDRVWRDGPEPTGPLYQLLKSPIDYLQIADERGSDVVFEAVKTECAAAMEENGNRQVLWYGERLQDLSGILEEYGGDNVVAFDDDDLNAAMEEWSE